MSQPPAILFVCLGNICRSPLAQAAFRAEAERAGLGADCDSAGTAAYHVGKAPDPRSIATAAEHGIDIRHYEARQVQTRDFARFTHVLAMDHQNLEDLKALAPGDTTARIGLLMDVVPGREGASIADPYYGGEENFLDTWDDATTAAKALVAKLLAEA